MSRTLTVPYRSVLAENLVAPKRAERLREQSRDWQSWTLTERQRYYLELLLWRGPRRCARSSAGVTTRASRIASCSISVMPTGTTKASLFRRHDDRDDGLRLPPDWTAP